MGLVDIKPPSLIIVSPDSVVIDVVTVVIIGNIITSIPRGTSVLIKNVELKILLESNYGSCCLNILRNSVPNQWSRDLDFFAAIVIAGSLGVESKGLLYIANVKVIISNDICAASGSMIMDFMIILKPFFENGRTIIG